MNTLEQLGLWYLRLNGYFTMPNFIAHADDGARTDIDVLGVRFPHSTEYPDDGARLRFPQDKIDIVLAEAKAGECAINGPWKGKSAAHPLEYVLKRVGVFGDPSLVDRAANEIYTRRRFPPDEESDKWSFVIRVLCFGKSENKGMHNVTQILWPQAISFIGKRFQTYAIEKADHDHWDSFGKFLWQELSGDELPSVDQLLADWKTACPCWP